MPPLVVKNCFLHFQQPDSSPVQSRIRSLTDSVLTPIPPPGLAPYMSPLQGPAYVGEPAFGKLDEEGEGGLSEASTEETESPARARLDTGASLASSILGPSCSPLTKAKANPALLYTPENHVLPPLAAAQMMAPWFCPPPAYGEWPMPGYDCGFGWPDGAYGMSKAGMNWAAATQATALHKQAAADVPRTTAMLRNLPPEYDGPMLLTLLDTQGFSALYTFVYLPIDFRTGHSFGYGFIDFTTPEVAEKFRAHFGGFTAWAVPSDRVGEVCWSEPLQGLEAHIERYRNSPMMHESVSDAFKPMLFDKGVRVPFPPPTKRLKPPRLRHAKGEAKE